MRIDLIPTGEDDIELHAHVDENNDVFWQLYNPQKEQEGPFDGFTNQYVVTRADNVIIVSALAWFYPKGKFELRLTGDTPDNIVRIANLASVLAVRSTDAGSLPKPTSLVK